MVNAKLHDEFQIFLGSSPVGTIAGVAAGKFLDLETISKNGSLLLIYDPGTGPIRHTAAVEVQGAGYTGSGKLVVDFTFPSPITKPTRLSFVKATDSPTIQTPPAIAVAIPSTVHVLDASEVWMPGTYTLRFWMGNQVCRCAFAKFDN